MQISKYVLSLNFYLKKSSFVVGSFVILHIFQSLPCSVINVTLPSICASLCMSSSLSFRPVMSFSLKGTHSIELRQLLAFLWRWSLFLELILTTKVQPPPKYFQKSEPLWKILVFTLLATELFHPWALLLSYSSIIFKDVVFSALG